ncbi:hypothetical protein LTR85_004440 [Meristemomyces frigidus]|nr:hypothetical protein LTR85_004440 [Meristemomyces frigidus]
MSSLLLEQVDCALLNAEQIRKELTEALGAGPPKERELDFRQQFCQASVCCHEQLEVAVYVARLTAAPGYQNKHRLSRLLNLVDSYMHAADLMLQGARRIKTNGSVDTWGAKLRHAENAVQMIDTSRDCLRLMCNGEQSHGAMIHSGNTVQLDDHDRLTKVNGLLGPLDANEYLRPGSVYEWASNAQYMVQHSNLAEDQVAGIVIERLAHTYRQIGTSTERLWNNVPREECGRKLPYDNINAVWLSPNAHVLLDTTGMDDYRELSDAVTNAVVGGTDYQRRYLAHRPACLAKALLTMQIDLGLLFDDDLSVLVWPLGKTHAVKGRSVVVQCGHYSEGGWRYRVVARVSGEASRQAATQIVSTEFTGVTGVASLASGTITRKDQQILGDQPRSRSKQVSFLDLPAELRNAIYAEYLSFQPKTYEEREKYGWVLQTQNLATAIPPEICSTCRQIRDEVAPLYLASKTFLVALPKRKVTPGKLVHASVMSTGNKWLPALPSAAHFRDIRFQLPGPRRGDVYLTLRAEAPGFELQPCLGRWQLGLAEHVEQLRELVRIVVHDRDTDGLSVADVAVIADFLNAHVIWTKWR